MSTPETGLTVPLGDSGLHASRLGWGMWRLRGDVAEALALAHAALDVGMTFFDTADIYGFGGEGFGAAESLLGEALARDPGLRGRIVLASKGGIDPGKPYNSSVAYLTHACEASLKRLRTDVIDLYQIHRPDLLAHPQDVAEALHRLRQAGKIRAAGVSNFTASQTRALQAHMPFPLASVQPEFSALAVAPLSDGVLDLAMEQGLVVLAWSPLGGGRLGDESADERARAVIVALDALAQKHNSTRAATAIAWVLAHPSRPVALIGTQSRDRLNIVARATQLTLSRREWYDVLVASRGAPMP